MDEGWREDRVASALRGENPAVLRRLDAGFAVLAEAQFLPGHALLLGDDPTVRRFAELPRERRVAFLADVDRLAGAVEETCRALDPACSGVDVELPGSGGPVAAVWPRYRWEPVDLRDRSVRRYPEERWRDPFFALGRGHDGLRSALRAALDRSAEDGPAGA
ncbi:diadenosine tetraphosphate hydrolase [Streptomyces lonarensis]|uniref:Diadenosine tetraphosphate hydrolase n=1 Tax=Streptomyces lonarensis TaxID=700599 RepID=A0A7X6D221_9ACTN|nr:diadenosine tetraphosphate hydrolase [Streptomyces lonarensis]NJQ06640.1 diadenosine tetraphosphate hydrolase [Streptomyces lonarensis]